jgi:diguanylate cyclase (GGDEF)-like protein
MPDDYDNTQIKTFSSIVNEEANVSKIIKGIAWITICVAFAVGIKTWFSGNHVHSTVNIVYAITMLTNITMFAWHKNYPWFRTTFLLLAGLMLAYLISSGGESNTGILWFYAFPPFLFYVAGLRTGSWIMAVMAVLTGLIFSYPEVSWIKAYYPSEFQFRFIASVTLVTIFAYVMEHSRRKTKEELISMGRLYEHAARTDELTQLPNRRDMQQQLAKEYSRYKRHGSYFSVILMDIDLFKSINDNYGHDAGDFILRHFSKLILETCRKIDTAARWGGEEFLVLLPDTSLVQALAMAERLRKKANENKFVFKNREINMTTSCGVSSISQTRDLSALLKQADVNLYQAKIKGRNMVIPLVMQKTNNDVSR